MHNDQNAFQNSDCCLDYCGTHVELAPAAQVLLDKALLPAPLPPTPVGCIGSESHQSTDQEV